MIQKTSKKIITKKHITVTIDLDVYEQLVMLGGKKLSHTVNKTLKQGLLQGAKVNKDSLSRYRQYLADKIKLFSDELSNTYRNEDEFN